MQVNFSRILYYLRPHVKKHWVSFSLIFFTYGVGAIFDSIIKPLIFGKMIDVFSSGFGRDVILQQAIYFLLLTAIVIVIHNIAFRAGDYATSYFESKVMKRLYDSTFENLLKHSYHFFSNNFSGSIIAKSKRFVKQFETFTDILSFQIWFSIVILIGVLFILFFKSPVLAYIFLGWSVLYILITFLFIRKKIYYDTQEAAADSLVTARLSDAILNILNIKIFISD